MTSSDRSEFYALFLRSCLKNLLVNVYSNTSSLTYNFPFIPLYNEFCNSLFIRQLQSACESNLFPSHCHITHRYLMEFPNRFCKPVTTCSLSHVLFPTVKQQIIPFSYSVLTVFQTYREQLGIQLIGDKEE